MDCGWLDSHVGFVVVCRGKCSKGVCMVALTPLGSKMREVWCACLFFVKQYGGDRVVGSGLCTFLVLGGVQE
jgi:hypothetical protein